MEFQNSIWLDYHNSSKDKSKGHIPIPFNDNEWPEDWKKTHYKIYERLPKLELPKPNKITFDVTEVLKKRRSIRDFSETSLSKQELSNLFYWACGEGVGEGHRVYPSGGGRFPVELYVVNLAAQADFGAGVYHYNFKEHNFDILWKKDFSKEERAAMFGYPWAKKSSIVILMTGVFNRTINKYGERGYRFVLLEAGHIGQNLSLVSTALGLGSCALGGVNEEYFEDLLDLEKDEESLVYSMVIGK